MLGHASLRRRTALVRAVLTVAVEAVVGITVVLDEPTEPLGRRSTVVDRAAAIEALFSLIPYSSSTATALAVRVRSTARSTVLRTRGGQR